MKTGRLYCREASTSPGNTLKVDRGIKNITNYHWQEYDCQPQNWSIIQDNRGVIYAANQGGLLEFDGLSWREIPIPNKTARSLAVDKQGTIYAGGINEIGYLAPGEKGDLHYVSLIDRLAEKYRNFSYVWRTHFLDESIYFSTSKFLFLRDGEKVKVWQADGSYGAPFVCGGKLYGREAGRGLLEMKDDSFELMSGGEEFASKTIALMIPIGTQRLLIGTRSSGLYLYDGAKAEPFPTTADDYLKENQISYGIRLISSPGQFAVGTRSGGIVIIDYRGNLRTIINKSSGLQDNKVHYIFEDSQGNLWLALNEGIAKIEYHSPFSFYNEQSGLPGIVLSVAVHSPANELYAGTTNGLYRLTPAGIFQPVPGISSACWQLLPVNTSILAAAGDGILQIENNVKKNICKHQSFVLCRSQRDKNRVWASTIAGLVSIYFKENRWLEEHRLEGIDREVMTIVEDRQGNLWLGTRTKGVLNVDLPGAGVIDNPAVSSYDTAHGLPSGEVHVFTAAGHVMFATGKGIFRFDEKKGVFVPDDTLGKEFAGGEQGRGVFRIAEDRDRNIYLHSHGKNIRAIRQPDGRFVLDRKPFLRLPIAQVNSIYPDPGGHRIWFAGHDGLIQYNTRVKKDYDLPFRCLIRRVSVTGEPVFHGYGKGTKYKGDNGSTSLYPVIDHENRIRFEFAAPFFEAESETQYRCLLKGYDKEWSPWSSETRKDYTNLDAGLNVFRVQARNVYGNIGSEDVFQFRILPPWYQTWWAFVLYGAAAFLIIFLIVRWRSGKLLKDKQRLEQIVKERTREIKEKNRQLEEQAEQLKEMDTIKSRFFANISHEFRTPLTLIMGPLEHMLSGSRLNEKEHKKNLRLMMRNTRRLLGLINRLLELSKYDSGKVELRAAENNILPFIKGIFTSFEPAAGQKDLAFTFHCDEEEEIMVYFDAGKLEEAVSNLLANAVKFTPAGGSVSVTVKKIHEKMDRFPAGAVAIAVRDTGPGIPVDKFDHIFDRFVQAESTHEHHHKGSGVGLAIAKEVVTLHHGTIDVTGREIGTDEPGGSEFTIRLPLGRAHLKDDEIIDTDASAGPTNVGPIWHEVPSGKVFAELFSKSTPKGPTTWAGDEDWSQEKDIILIIEDSADMRAYIRGALEPIYSVIEAEDGRQGIDKAREVIPDLIISDVMMPEVDGCELCRVLKNDRATSHIPVILLTAKAGEENIIEGLETGADDYITKPFSIKILLARIKNLIELRRHLQDTWKREMNLQPAKMVESVVDKEFIKELKEVMEKNISDTGFNVEQLGRKLYMSHATLYRKIQALTGESPTDFIRSYRLKRGAELLKTTSCTVLEAAFEVGFSSTAYFTKCFKEKFHQLPSTYIGADSTLEIKDKQKF